MIFSFLLQHHVSYFPSISDLMPIVSKFQHHKQLRSKSNTLQVSSLKFMSNLLVKRTLIFLDSALTIAILEFISHVHYTLHYLLSCYKIFEIFHSFLICHVLYLGVIAFRHCNRTFFHIHLHSIIHFHSSHSSFLIQ